MIRLDKACANMGLGTRSQVKKAIHDGFVKVNGICQKSQDYKVEENDVLTYQDMEVRFQSLVYFMLNKPEGVVSATKDSQETVLDLIGIPIKGLYPVGRLDKDTQGLLLITNDGPLGHQLLSPKHHVEKEYVVQMQNPLSLEDIEAIQKGLPIDQGEVCAPAKVLYDSGLTCHLILQEGKYHQVKRMMEALGNVCVSLKRIRMKNLILDEELEEGQYRPLTKEEIEDLKESAPL